MNTESILVVSSKPLFREALKLLIEKATCALVTTAPDEVDITQLISEFTPNIVVIDRPDIKATGLDSLFRQDDYPAKVVLIGWEDDIIVVYSRSKVRKAKLTGLINIIKKGVVKSPSQAFQLKKDFKSR